jgi:hypothetical protein
MPRWNDIDEAPALAFISDGGGCMADDRNTGRTNMDSSENQEPVGNIGPDADGDRDERMRDRESTDDEDDLDEEGEDLQELQREGNLGNERVRDRDS